MRAELLGGARPGRDRRDRRRDPRDRRVLAARRGPRRVHEPHRLHLRRRARGRRRGGAGGGPGRSPPDRHADAEGRAPPGGRFGRLPVRPGLGRDDGRVRGPRERVRATRGGRAGHSRLPLRARREGRPPPDAPADPGGGVRGAPGADREAGVGARLRPGPVRAPVGRDVRRRPRLPDRLQRERPRDEGAGPSHRPRRPRAGAGPRRARPAEGGAGHRVVGGGVRPRTGVDQPRGLPDDAAARSLRGVRGGSPRPQPGRGGIRARRPHPAAGDAGGGRALHCEGEPLPPRRAAEDPPRRRAARALVGAALRPGEAHHRVHDPEGGGGAARVDERARLRGAPGLAHPGPRRAAPPLRSSPRWARRSGPWWAG